MPGSKTGVSQAAITDSLARAPNVDLELPKFKIEGGSVSLASALKARGMKDAFTPAADFSGITTPEKPAVERLALGDVIHQAFVAVDEKGTEAAAATAVIGVGTTSVDPPEEVIHVTFDKPFVFFVRDNATGAVLFLGRLASM